MDVDIVTTCSVSVIQMVFEELKNCSDPFFYWGIRIEGGCMYIHGEEDIIWVGGHQGTYHGVC